MNVQSLRNALTLVCALEQEARAAERTTFAEQGLNLIASAHCIGHGFKAETDAAGENVKPDAAYTAQWRRGAVLRLAVIHELLMLAPGTSHGRTDFVSLVAQRAFQAAMSTPTIGLRPAFDAANGLTPRNAIAETPGFFNEFLGRSLALLDNSLGLDLAGQVGGPYRSDDPASVARWYRAWTCASALAVVDWLRWRGCTGVADFARALWFHTDPFGAPLKRFKGNDATLPTGRVKIGADNVPINVSLRLQPVLVQALEGKPVPIAQLTDDDCSLKLSLRTLDYKAVRGEVSYMGRGVFDIYLAILAGCLLEARCGEPEIELHQNLFNALWTPGPTQAIAPAQRRSLQDLQRARRAELAGGTLPPAPRRPRALRAAPPPPAHNVIWIPAASHRIEASEGTGSAARPGEVPQPAHNAGSAIAALDLSAHLDESVLWVDLACVVSNGDHEVVMPLAARASGTDPFNGGGHGALLLYPANVASTAITPTELRLALQRADHVCCVVQHVGSGAFVLIDIDIAGAAGKPPPLHERVGAAG